MNSMPGLQREQFAMSRLLEYFTAEELEMQIGHAQALWPVAIGKELADNGVEAAESAGSAPEIRIVFGQGSLLVEDNGPGLPAAIVARSLDYSVRVSTNSRYVSPTRGQLGNALMTIWAAAFVADGVHGRIEIDTPGLAHIIDVRLDRLAQAPKIDHQQAASTRKNGTLVRLPWPLQASSPNAEDSADSSHGRAFADLAAGYALFNPHLALTLDTPFGVSAWQPTVVGWQKWLASAPTSAHWYTRQQFMDLIAAYVVVERETGRIRTVRDLIAEFRGLSSTAKLRSVAEAAGLHGVRLADLCHGDEIDQEAVGRLLRAMQAASKPVDGKHLGTIGKEAFRTRLVRDLGVADASFQYERVERVVVGEQGAGTTLPVVLEVAFGVRDPAADRWLVLTGVNWSPTIGPAFPSLRRALSAANVQHDDPIVLAVHVALPAVSFSDRGKGELTVDVRGILDPAVEKVTRAWTKAKRQRLRMAQARVRSFLAPSPTRLSIKAACFQVMEWAYLKASAGGTLPARGRQVMYAARPEVMKLTGGEFYAPSSQTFQQETLVSYMEQHPEATAGWNVVWDDRGQVTEPHTARRVGLGTLAVRGYLAAWTEGQVTDARSEIATALEQAALVATCGPAARYGAVLFCEKEGFGELFEAVRLGARYDLAIMSTKGMSTTSARELVDAFGRAGIPIFVLHDFDNSGMSIAHTLGTSSRRYRFEQPPTLIDLGLRLEDVQALGLDDLAEEVEYDSRKDPRENLAASGATEEEQRFLVSHGAPYRWYGRRVELNAMTSDQLVAWLEAKLQAHGVKKVVPDLAVLDAAYRRAVRLARLAAVLDAEMARLEAVAVDVPNDPAEDVAALIEGTPTTWDAAVRARARDRVAQDEGGT